MSVVGRVDGGTVSVPSVESLSATPGRGVVRNRVALILVCLARADV